MLRRIAVIIILGLIAYGSMLPAPFKTMDDQLSIVENPTIKSTANISEIFRQGYFHDQYYYRPLVNLSFMGEYQVFGFKSFFYNLDNLILHIVNALLVFLLVSRLTSNASIGFWTGILFVIHPVQWEAVCNIPGRAILMSAFFVLSSFILYLEFYKDRHWYYLPIIVITFFAGLLCKESTGILPLVLIAYLSLDRSISWWDRAKHFWPFLVGIAAYFLLRHHLGITKVFHADDPRALMLGFVTFLRSVITDLRLFVLPVDLHFDRCLPLFISFTYPPAVFVMFFWVIVLVLLFCWRGKISPFVFFLMGWFALELLPVSQLITGIGVGTGRVSTAEHFLYVACIPVLIGMVMFFRWLSEKGFVKPPLLKCIAGGFLAFLLLTAVEQSIYASSEFSMLQRSLSFEPNNPRIQGAMGLLSVYRNDIPDAEMHFRAAVKAEPLNPTYRISLGTALCQQGKWMEGLAQFVVFDPGKDKAMVQRQEKLTMSHIQEQLSHGKTFDARGWLTIGVYYAQTGQIQPAIDAFLKAVSLNPSQSDAWLDLGSLYEAEQDWPAAKAAYQKLLTIQDLTVFQRELGTKHLMTIEKR